MNKEIKQLFQQLGGKKIVFTPEIKVVQQGKGPTWIDNLYPAGDTLFVTISNQDDNYKIRFDMLNDTEEAALLKRLKWLVTPKEKPVEEPAKKKTKKAA